MASATRLENERVVVPTFERSIWQRIATAFDDGSGYLFILPMLIIYTLFSVWPILRGLVMAFMDYDWIYRDAAHFNGIDNYVEIASDTMFWHTLGRSMYFVLLFVPISIILPLIVASLIASIKNPATSGFFRVVLYFPVILPIAVAMLLWRHAFNGSFGWINVILTQAFGFTRAQLPGWLSDPMLTMPVTAFATIWKNFGQNVLFFLIGLYSINPELYEAAALDGAGAIQRWRYITIPQLKPVFVIVFILSSKFIGVTQEPLIMWGDPHNPGGGPADAAYTLGLYAYNVAFRFGDLRWGYAAALSLVAGVIGMIVAGIIFITLRSKEEEVV